MVFNKFQIYTSILNLTPINTWLLYKDTLGNNIARRKFLLKLIKEIVVTKQEQGEDKYQQSITEKPLKQKQYVLLKN